MAFRDPGTTLRGVLRNGNIFGGPPPSDFRNATDSIYADMRAPMMPYASPVSSPATSGAFNGGTANQLPQTAPGSSLNLAAGNIFGGILPRAERTDIQHLPAQTQLAGLVSGAADQGRMADYYSRLKMAGISLNPEGQIPTEFQGSLRNAQGIYDNIFTPPGTVPTQGAPVGYQIFAPT